jgi:hypothetical protein
VGRKEQETSNPRARSTAVVRPKGRKEGRKGGTKVILRMEGRKEAREQGYLEK